MPVIDANKGPKGRAGLDLALVLEHLVRLDHGHREFTARAPADVLGPHQPISHEVSATARVVVDSVVVVVVVALKWPPTEREEIHQRLEHPTSLGGKP